MRSAAKGLTLLEVLVAATLGLMVLTLCIRTLVPTMVASRKAGDRVDLHQRATFLGERVVRELRLSARAGVGIFTGPDAALVSVHPRSPSGAGISWSGQLSLFSWREKSVSAYTVPLTTVPTGPVVPPLSAMTAVPAQTLWKVDGVERFGLLLDSGPAAQLTLSLKKGDETMELTRHVFFRNGSD